MVLTICSEKDSEPRRHHREPHCSAGHPRQHVLGIDKCYTYRHDCTTLPSSRHVPNLHNWNRNCLCGVDGGLGTICYREFGGSGNTGSGFYFRVLPREYTCVP